MNGLRRTTWNTTLINGMRNFASIRRTATLLTFTIFVAINVCYTACSRHSSQPVSPLDAEAQRTAEQFWYSALTKCGDSYYAKDNREIAGADLLTYQFNDVSVEVSPNKLAEADRLNGVEWQGLVILLAKTSRSHVSNWGEWRNGSVFTGNSVVLKKVNGRWLFHGRENFRHPLKKIDCSEVPQ